VLKGVRSNLDEAALSPEDFIQGDPELDFESAGEILDPDELSTAYHLPDEKAIVSEFERLEVIYNPDGTEKERRPRVVRKPNLNEAAPIKEIRRLPRDKALTMFTFRQCMQVVHNDGLTYDHLFAIAKELHEKKELAMIGGGPKGNQPLVTREGGSPYRAFLHGEIGSGEDQGKYRLLLLLSNMELKKPQPQE
jgi:hypothetical protein